MRTEVSNQILNFKGLLQFVNSKNGYDFTASYVRRQAIYPHHITELPQQSMELGAGMTVAADRVKECPRSYG